jgi:hypothetical protein
MAATRALLPASATKDLLTATRGASNELENLLGAGTLTSDEAMKAVKAKADAIVGNLGDDAQKHFAALPDGIAKYREIAAVGVGLADTLSAQAKATALKVDDALKLANHFGDFERAQADLVANFSKQSKSVQESLSKDLDDAQKAWPRLL